MICHRFLLSKDGEVLDEIELDEPSHELAKDIFAEFGWDMTTHSVSYDGPTEGE